MVRKTDLLITPLCEGALILTLAAIGWATRQPLVFTSLGPTAYEIVEKPDSPSARSYNIIAGHVLALGAGFLSLWLLNAWASPKVASAGFVASPRMWAAVIAVVLSALGTLAIRATQPASMSTALLVSLGSMQTARDAVAIVAAVLIIAAIGEPLRRSRSRANRHEDRRPKAA